MEKRLLEKYYTVLLKQFYDAMGRNRREIDIVPIFVYQLPVGGSDVYALHLVWYSRPDQEQYFAWVFEQLVIATGHIEVLRETALVSEITALSYNSQPQDFEKRLQALGFHRK